MKNKVIISNRKVRFVIEELKEPNIRIHKCWQCDAAYGGNGIQYCGCISFDCLGDQVLKLEDKSKQVKPNQILSIGSNKYFVTKGKCNTCDLFDGKCTLKYYMCKGNMALKKATSEGI